MPRCRNVRHFLASDLMCVLGGNRDPQTLRLRCTSCEPPPTTIRLLPTYAVEGKPLNLWRPVMDAGRVKGWKPDREE